MRSTAPAGALLAAAAIAVGGCGGDSSTAESVSLVPDSAFVYAEATIKPDGDQREQIEELLAKFPNGDDAGARLVALVEEELRKSDAPIGWQDDIEPWLGDKAAAFALGLRPEGFEEFGLMLQAEDEDEAMEAVDKAAEGEARDAEYEGVDLKRLPGGTSAGVLDGWLVIGTRRGFELAVHASKGERSLEDSDQYAESTDDMEDDLLGFVYFDARAIIGAVPNGTMRLGAVANLLLRPFVITFDADAEGVEVSATVPEALGEALGILVGKGSKLMDDAPADAWFAAGSPDLGESLKTVLDVASQEIGGRAVLGRRLHRATRLDLERDLLDWMGDAAYFVRGPSATTLSGAVVIESTDVNASHRALAAVGPLLRPPSRFPREPVTAPGGGNGFSVRVRELPEPVHYFERDGKVVVAYGNDAVRQVFEPSETLGESSAYRDAAESLGEGYDVSTYVRLGPIVRLLDSTPLADDDGWQQAKPYVEPLVALVAGAKKDGEDVTARLRLTVD